VSLVGYTNSGKSTLLNALTDSDALVENRLFATLDPRTRRLELPGGEPVLISDTVGFVRKLPHLLVESFHSTLEVVADSDLLVHVIDASAADPEGQIAAVRAVLAEIEADGVPELRVFNKADKAPEEARLLAAATPGAVAVSALTGAGLEELLVAVGDELRAADRTIDLNVPYERGDVIAALHRAGEVVDQTDDGEHLALRVRLDDAGRRRFAEFVTRPTQTSVATSGPEGSDNGRGVGVEP
jgi:GTP-binding protein HflX